MCVSKNFWSKLIIVSLLTALVVKNSHILALTYFILLKKRPTPNLKGYQIRQVLALFSN